MEIKFKEGSLRSNRNSYLPTTRSEFDFRVWFDESCLFEFPTDGWHKIVGRATNGSHWHKDSYRLGWRPRLDLGKIELAGYTYRKGVRQTIPNKHHETEEDFNVHLGFLDPNEEARIVMYHQRFKYVFQLHKGDVMQSLIRLPARKEKNWIPGFNLNPYMASSIPATQDFHYNIIYSD